MRSDPSRLAIALSAARSYAGPLLAAGGVVLEVIGWFCVSGESLTARQLPYIASASIPGAALIVSGAVLTAGRHAAGDETARRVAELHALLVDHPPEWYDDGADGHRGAVRPAPPEAVPARPAGGTEGSASLPPAPAGSAERDAGRQGTETAGDVQDAGVAGGSGRGPVTVPDGTTFHDPACGLVRGKPSTPVTGAQIAARGLSPCPVCDPGTG